ncbi:hypothetical protein [Alkalilimnicola ehrlichii]|uniref:hypothetical protein n=1 Tax=Alkalilimnicola ehrlichii TaxID=351052 RepID=UPI0015F28E69|nr:hypothetical protein [Alkalilimnicola ehrlichii]
MADIADKAAALQAAEIEHSIRQRAGHLDGPDDCVKCGEWNDRAEQGYAVCTACVGERE